MVLCHHLQCSWSDLLLPFTSDMWCAGLGEQGCYSTCGCEFGGERMQRSSSGMEEHGTEGTRQQGTAEGAKKPGGRRRKHSMQGGSREAQGCRDAGSRLEAKQDAFLKRYIAKSHLPHLMAQRTSASNSASRSCSEPSSTTPDPRISFHAAFLWLSRTLAALPSLFPGADT